MMNKTTFHTGTKGCDRAPLLGHERNSFNSLSVLGPGGKCGGADGSRGADGNRGTDGNRDNTSMTPHVSLQVREGSEDLFGDLAPKGLMPVNVARGQNGEAPLLLGVHKGRDKPGLTSLGGQGVVLRRRLLLKEGLRGMSAPNGPGSGLCIAT